MFVRLYADGGTTTIDIGEPACGYHNRWKHRTRTRNNTDDDEPDGVDDGAG